MQRYDAIAILVTALVFLVLSAGIFALFKASLRQSSREWARFGVVWIRAGRMFFALGAMCEWLVLVVACLCGLGVLQGQLGPQAVQNDNLAVVLELSEGFLLISGVLVVVGWLVAHSISELRKRHATVSHVVAALAPFLQVVMVLVSTAVLGVLKARFGLGWYLLPVGVLDLVVVLSIQMVILRSIRRSYSTPSRQHH